MFDDFREWLSDNLRYILLGLAVIFVILIGVLVFRLIKGPSSSEDKSNPPAVTAQTEVAVKTDEADNAGTADPAEAVSEAEAAPAAAASEDGTLVKNDAAILTLMNNYYTAKYNEDSDALAQMVDPWNEEVEGRVLQNAMVEGITNLSTYSANGADEGSYAVFSYYDAVIKGIDTGVPTLVASYLKRNDDGNLKVYFYENDAEVSAFMQQISNTDSVKSLVKEVKTKYESVRSANPDLDALLQSMGSDSSSSQETEAETEGSREMNALADLNIRASASTEADILGYVLTGETVTVLGAEEADGFVRISYDDGAGNIIEGYVKLEYLS